MEKIQSVKTSRAPRRTLLRMVAGCGIALGSLAVATPSWAGPMMGC